MNTRSLPDGSLAIHEQWTLLRTVCVAGAVLLPALMVLAEIGNDAIRYGRVAGGVFGSMLLLLIAGIVEDRHFAFDATRSVLTWKQRNWFRSRAGHLPFADIKDVLVTSQRSRDDDNRSKITYSCVLVTSNGQMPLTSTFGYVQRDYEQLASAVRTLISAPKKAIEDVDLIDRLIAAGRMIDAIGEIRSRQGLGLAEAQALAAAIKRRQGQGH